jgi:hypothetical protein
MSTPKGIIRYCRACRKRLPGRARQRQFCNPACRMWFARTRKKGGYEQTPTACDVAQINIEKSVTFKRLLPDPRSLSKGIRGPRRVLDIEIGPSRTWRPTAPGRELDR